MRYRITNFQKKILNNKDYNNFIIKNLSNNFNINNYFNNFNKNILEIGFGNGKNLLNNSIFNKNINFIGIEIFLPGIANLIGNIILKSINNLKIIRENVKYVINKFIENSFNEIFILFPDPWEKNKQKKRRFLSIYFINNLIKILNNDSKLHITTDSLDYFNYIINNINILIKISNNFFIYNIILYKNKLFDTIFEIKSIKKNKVIYYIIIKKY